MSSASSYNGRGRGQRHARGRGGSWRGSRGRAGSVGSSRGGHTPGYRGRAGSVGSSHGRLSPTKEDRRSSFVSAASPAKIKPETADDLRVDENRPPQPSDAQPTSSAQQVRRPTEAEPGSLADD